MAVECMSERRLLVVVLDANGHLWGSRLAKNERKTTDEKRELEFKDVWIALVQYIGAFNVTGSCQLGVIVCHSKGSKFIFHGNCADFCWDAQRQTATDEVVGFVRAGGGAGGESMIGAALTQALTYANRIVQSFPTREIKDGRRVVQTLPGCEAQILCVEATQAPPLAPAPVSRQSYGNAAAAAAVGGRHLGGSSGGTPEALGGAPRFEPFPRQFMALMNVGYAAKKKGIMVDVLSLGDASSPLLKQVAMNSGGVWRNFPWFDVQSGWGGGGPGGGMQRGGRPDADGPSEDIYVSGNLLPFMLLHFLATKSARGILRGLKADSEKQLTSQQAVCFCHHRAVRDLAFVCSSCLAIYCSETVDENLSKCRVCGARPGSENMKPEKRPLNSLLI